MADHWISVAVDIKRAELLVTGRGEVFSKVVTQVCVTRGPADVELSLLDAVLDPVVAHIHSLGSFLENSFVCNSICGGVAGFDLCSILEVSHFLERFTCDSTSFGIDKQGTILASATEETTCLRTVDWHSRGPFERDVHWECLMLLRKK
jgi:hypothetical protein